MGDSDDTYPHWKEALFGDDRAANIYCAVKYALWHGSHVLMLALLSVSVLSKKVLDSAASLVNRYDSEQFAFLISWKDNPTVKKVFRYLGIILGVAFILGGIIGIGIVVYYASMNPVSTAFSAGIAIGAMVVAKIVSIVLEKVVPTVATVKKSNENKPIIRRIAGYCPVSMDMEPKWFESIADRFK